MGTVMMKTVADPAVRQSLIERLTTLTPASERRWGTLTAQEMLCHLGDACEMVLRVRPRTKPITAVARPIFKRLALWTPLRAPRGMKTNPDHDPRLAGTRPAAFADDLQRVIAGLEGIAAADAGALEPAHGMLGIMTLADWQRWAYKHTDHHLRQFGV
jgi:hypothetical protein